MARAAGATARTYGSWAPAPPRSRALSHPQPPSSQDGDQPPPFPLAAGHLTAPGPAPRASAPPLRACAETPGLRGPEARAGSPGGARRARGRPGRREAACGHARAHAPRGSAALRGRAGLRVRGLPAGGARQAGGCWEAREARGPAREPPGAGKTRLLLTLPPPFPPHLPFPAPSSYFNPSPLLKPNSFIYFFRGGRLPFEGRSRRGGRPSSRVTHAPSAPQQLRDPLHPRSPLPLGEDSLTGPLGRCTPFLSYPAPQAPTAPSQLPSSRRGPYPTSTLSAAQPCIRPPLPGPFC